VLTNESGLLGVSAISSDMRSLLQNEATDPRAAHAIELFVYRISRELGSMAAALGGLDALVFTGGIGENAAAIRDRVCHLARWLDVQIDRAANERGESRISSEISSVPVWVVPTDEELMIAKHIQSLLKLGK
jgi:acetate kinase